jgi:thiol-disulfide isomerase/thioredoxin
MNFRNFISYTLFIALIINTSCTSKKEFTPTISGTISNLNETSIILSKIENIQEQNSTVIDTLVVDFNGNFNYKKQLTPSIYTLTFDNNNLVTLVIDEGQQIKIEGSHLDSLTIYGSIDTQLLMDYEAFRKESLNRLVNSVRNKITALQKQQITEDEIATLRALEVENYKKHLDELTIFIEENMGTSIAIYPTSIRWNTENLETYKKIVSNFKTAHPTSKIIAELENRITLLEKTAIGSVFSTIEMPSETDKIISLNTIKGTFTLIDFWASWCPPCRSESRLLNELYAKYKSKGFEIYGISLDSKKQRWLDALEKDNRIWNNVATLEGFKTPVAQEYGITALPTNFIIDANGKIIAANLHGKHLKAFVESLFKTGLDKP